jgi:quinoprotein glucose dehydrogenase
MTIDHSFLRRLPGKIYSVVLALVGLVMAGLGVELAMLGGSPYYVVTGVLVLASAVLLWRGDRRGAWLYAAMIAGTIIWSLWEVGLDGWALAPRIAGPVVLGAWLLTPWAFEGPAPVSIRGRHVAVSALVTGVVVLLAMGGHDLVNQHPAPASDPHAPDATGADSGDWPFYGRDQGGQRFSPLRTITPENVGRLELLWTYQTGFDSLGMRFPFEATPLKIGSSLYLCTPDSDVIALDADSGREKWRYRAQADRSEVVFAACRGVSYFRDPAVFADAPCAERIFSTAVDGRLFALDAASGKLCPSFGEHGTIDLKRGMGKVEKGYYYVTSAPLVMRGRVVVGGFVPDNQHLGEPSGVIRAFDAVNGKLAWAFDAGRPGMRGEPPQGLTYTPDTPNSWAPLSGDDALGLVYAPMGNATPDWYGGQRRPFDEKYSSSVLALDIATGAARWSFQTTHHDLWDYDVPAQPTLYDVPSGTHRVPGLVQGTKRGQLFVLDRRTGRPIVPVEERPVPQSDVPGERTAATQPYTIGLPHFAGPRLTEKMMWGLTPIDQAWCRIQFRKLRDLGEMTPAAVGRASLIYPGYQGGIDWGGVSVDPQRDILITNTSRMAMRAMLIPRAEADRRGIQPMGSKGQGDPGGASAQAGTPYAIDVAPFLSPLGIPCQQPPYGMISAVDMKTKKLLWEKRLGTAVDSGPGKLRSMLPITMGVPNAGGSLLTASGLTFIGATQERAFRALDTRTGQELWKFRMPAGAQATPMTYRASDGRQVVVITAGGHALLRSKPGDYVMAFALPNRK